MDILYLGVVLLFLALSWGLVTFCDIYKNNRRRS